MSDTQGAVTAHAARAIWNVTPKRPAYQDAAREAGAIPALVKLLQDPETKARSAHTNQHNIPYSLKEEVCRLWYVQVQPIHAPQWTTWLRESLSGTPARPL
jgi:hypothetical protein